MSLIIPILIDAKTNTSARNSNEKLKESLKNVTFSDEQHKNHTIIVLNQYLTANTRLLKANKVQKKIVDLLTDQVIAIIHGTMVALLTNYIVGSAINALSQKIQLKLDSKRVQYMIN